MSNTGIDIPVAGGGGGGGGATEATLLLVLAVLTGSKRPLETVVSTIDGVTPDDVQSMSIYFDGPGGTFGGAAVPDQWIGSFTPNKGDDTVESKAYTVPIGGTGEVTITYIDL